MVTLEFTLSDHPDFSHDSMPPPLRIPKHFTGFAKGTMMAEPVGQQQCQGICSLLLILSANQLPSEDF